MLFTLQLVSENNGEMASCRRIASALKVCNFTSNVYFGHSVNTEEHVLFSTTKIQILNTVPFSSDNQKNFLGVHNSFIEKKRKIRVPKIFFITENWKKAVNIHVIHGNQDRSFKEIEKQ